MDRLGANLDCKNWSTMWKTLVIVNQGIFVIASVIPTMSIAPLTPIFMQQWQKSLADVALLVRQRFSLVYIASLVHLIATLLRSRNRAALSQQVLMPYPFGTPHPMALE